MCLNGMYVAQIRVCIEAIDLTIENGRCIAAKS